MKKSIRIIILLMTCIFLLSFPVTAHADNDLDIYNVETSARLAHCDKCNVDFKQSNSNNAYVSINYITTPTTFSQIKVTVQIQKKVLGLFWKTVDIDDSKEWTTTSTSTSGLLRKTISIDGSGTYRANFTIESRGKDGSIDTEQKSITQKFN